MAIKLDLNIKEENILTVHLDLCERKSQSLFKKLLTDGIIILKWPIKKQIGRIHVA